MIFQLVAEWCSVSVLSCSSAQKCRINYVVDHTHMGVPSVLTHLITRFSSLDWTTFYQLVLTGVKVRYVKEVKLPAGLGYLSLKMSRKAVILPRLLTSSSFVNITCVSEKLKLTDLWCSSASIHSCTLPP